MNLTPLAWGVPSFWIERFPLYYGRHLGLFEKQGIDLRIRYFWGGPELARALFEGRIMIGEMGLPPFLKAFSEGLPARVIGSSIVQKLDHYLVSRPEISSFGDLREKRLGILSAGSCDDYFALAMLRSAGLVPGRDVTLLPLGSAYGDLRCFSPPPETGFPRPDAAFLVEPFVSRGERLGLLRILATVRDYYPRYQWGIILAHADALTRRRDLLERAMAGFRASCRAIADNPEAAVPFGAQVFRIPKKDFRTALLRDMAHWETDARLDMEGMKTCLEVQQESGAVAPELSLDGMVEQM